MLYTNTGSEAEWRQTIDLVTPWEEKPALACLDGFNLRMVQCDWMHTVNLGIAQDLVGAAVKLLCRKPGVFSGSTIKLRLNQFFLELKAWAREHGKVVGLKRLRKDTLGWSKGCPVLRAKAADAPVFMAYLCDKLEAIEWDGPFKSLLAAVWCANQISGLAMTASTFLTLEEKHNLAVLGNTFLQVYSGLACEARDLRRFLFRMRPKMHHFQHVVEEDRPSRRNPAWDNTFMDEDHVRYCTRMLRKISHRTAELNLLRRNAIQVKQYLLAKGVVFAGATVDGEMYCTFFF